MDPNISSPANPKASELYKKNKKDYAARVKKMIEEHCKKPKKKGRPKKIIKIIIKTIDNYLL